MTLGALGRARGGLPWSAVSLADGTIRVEQALVLLGGEPTLTETKPDASAAEIAIDAAMVAALREHRARQAAERLAAGPAYATSDLVFVDELGEPIHPDAFLRAFK